MSLEAVTQKLMNVIVDTRDFIDTRIAEVTTSSSILTYYLVSFNVMHPLVALAEECCQTKHSALTVNR